MKIKKILAIILIVIAMLPMQVSALFEKEAPKEFIFGVGPETQGYTIDYRYYSPVKENDNTKYPLVIWLHGMGNGGRDGKQIDTNNIGNWTTDDYQRRFKDSGGAFILAPRSLEEDGIYWDDELIYPLRATIDSFIEEHKENIDLQRIYVGGYSMGGKMTLKLAVAYPEMFAAVFPVCPAWIPGEEATVYLKDMPVWITSGARDPLVNYYAYLLPTWDNIIAHSNNPRDCRLSTLMVTLNPNGQPLLSSHQSWNSVTNDMFSSLKLDYPMMKTQDGLGRKVDLKYPDGMISWLSGFRSDYDGEKGSDCTNWDALKSDGRAKGLNSICVFFRNVFRYRFYALDFTR